MSDASALASNQGLPIEEKSAFCICGIPDYFFLNFSGIVLSATYPGISPAGMTGAFSLMNVIGASAPGIVTKYMVCSRADEAILFPMFNPAQETLPEPAEAATERCALGS